MLARENGIVRLVASSAGIRQLSLFRYTAVAMRLFHFAAAVSAMVFCLVLVVWFAAGAVDPHKQFISLSRDFHLSVSACGVDARLHFFNDSNFGPYGGSIVGIAGDPNGPKVSGIGDVVGVYYRMMRWPNRISVWTLSLSMIYPLTISAVLPVAWIIRRSRHRERGLPVEAPSAAV